MIKDNDSATIRSISWIEVFPWLHITRCFKIALSLRILFFAAVGTLVCTLGWLAIGYLFGSFARNLHSLDKAILSRPLTTSQFVPNIEPGRNLVQDVEYNKATSQSGILISNKADRRRSLNAITPYGVLSQDIMVQQSYLSSSPTFKPMQIVQTYYRNALAVDDCGQKSLCLFYYGIHLFWFLIVWGICGGAIVRAAAVRLCTDEKISLGRMFAFAQRKWISLMGTMLLPLVLMLVIAIGIGLFGLLQTFGLGALQAIVWPILLIGGLIMTLLWIGLLLGWPLMFGAIGVENSDMFDAISRAYSYIYQRPIHYFFYRGFASLVGLVGLYFVHIICSMTVKLTAWSACQVEGTFSVWAQDWNLLVMTIPGVFVSAFFWVAAAAVYLQLRKDVDQTELDVVEIEPEYVYGAELPGIKTDEQGAPVAEPVDETVAETDSTSEK